MKLISSVGESDDGSKGRFTFNLARFTGIQGQICFKYEKNERINLSLDEVTPKSFIDVLDHYLMHTIEEIVETKIEMDKIVPVDSQILKTAEEMIDIAMYVGSIRAILFINWKDLAKKVGIVEVPGQSITDYLEIFYDREFPRKDTDFLSNVLERVVYIRMFFPERKWHKEWPDPADMDLWNRVNNSLGQTEQIIADIVSKCASWLGAEGFERLLRAKQTKVLGLEKPVGGAHI